MRRWYTGTDMANIGIFFFAVIPPIVVVAFLIGAGQGCRKGQDDGFRSGHAEGWSAYHRSRRDNRGRFKK